MLQYSVEHQQAACASCVSSVLERVPGADHHLCQHARVLRVYRRLRVAAAVAFADLCRGALRRERRA